ncbi:MAG: SpoIIIAH-like family protein [Clostridiales bacterium]|nr:SpoIIIAH-like family protein [Clostridiales bacterium]
MMNLWKRNAVVAAIVLFVCVAVYLNWSYDQSDTAMGDSSVSAGKTLGEAELVNSDSQILLSDSSADGSASADTSAESSAESALAAEDGEWAEDALGEEELAAETDSYFDTARLNREEARDSALSILQETVDDPEADETAVSAAAESITAMASATLQESEIESLILAKGYTDCVAFIGDNSVSVVVSAGGVELEASDVAVVTDIVCGETDFSASNVKVIQAEE